MHCYNFYYRIFFKYRSKQTESSDENENRPVPSISVTANDNSDSDSESESPILWRDYYGDDEERKYHGKGFLLTIDLIFMSQIAGFLNFIFKSNFLKAKCVCIKIRSVAPNYKILGE